MRCSPEQGILGESRESTRPLMVLISQKMMMFTEQTRNDKDVRQQQ
jgi:hypothetical protein